MKEKTGAREGDTRRVSASRAPVFFLCPLLPRACYAGYTRSTCSKGAVMAVGQSCFGSFDNITTGTPCANSFPLFKIRWIVHVLISF